MLGLEDQKGSNFDWQALGSVTDVSRLIQELKKLSG